MARGAEFGTQLDAGGIVSRLEIENQIAGRPCRRGRTRGLGENGRGGEDHPKQNQHLLSLYRAAAFHIGRPHHGEHEIAEPVRSLTGKLAYSVCPLTDARGSAAAPNRDGQFDD